MRCEPCSDEHISAGRAISASASRLNRSAMFPPGSTSDRGGLKSNQLSPEPVRGRHRRATGRLDQLRLQ